MDDDRLERTQRRCGERLTRRDLLRMAAGGAGALALAPALGARPARAGAAPSGRLTVGMGSIAPTLDPHRLVAAPATIPYYAMFDPLVTVKVTDPTVLEPALATSWRNVNDTTWEFRLRSGVRFHNGDGFSARDVKFTIERALNPDNKLPIRTRVASVKTVETPDAMTVRIITLEPDPILPKRLSTLFIVPADYVAKAGAAGFEAKPVGTGAFQFKAFARGTAITLAAGPNSWRGAPKVAEVIIRNMPEPGVRVAALKTGEVDLIDGVPPDQAADLQRGGFAVSSAVRGAVFMYELGSILGLTPFKDKKVRQAVNYAIDKEALVKEIMRGYGRPAQGQLVGSDAFGFAPNVPAYPYDPNKARQLLAEAMYPNGFDTVISTTQGANPNDKEITEAVVGYLQRVGVRAKIEILQFAVFAQKFYDDKGGRGAMFAWAPAYYQVMDADFALNWFDSSRPEKRYNNPEFDRLYRASRTEMNPQRRLQQLQQAAAVLREDPPAMFVLQPANVYAASRRVQGFTARPDVIITFDSIAKT
ncbi:MAG: hypothetical protein HY660_10355 [Armatimonadetes bacterium]|nr:hypothetical protein [Armatimonadota bacterium]